MKVKTITCELRLWVRAPMDRCTLTLMIGQFVLVTIYFSTSGTTRASLNLDYRDEDCSQRRSRVGQICTVALGWNKARHRKGLNIVNKQEHERLENLLEVEIIKRILPVYVICLGWFCYDAIPRMIAEVATLSTKYGIPIATAYASVAGILFLLICFLLLFVAAAFASLVTICWPLPAELEQYDPEWRYTSF